MTHSRMRKSLLVEKLTPLFCETDPVFLLQLSIEWLHTKERTGRAMSVKERIMTIRLMEKLQANPAYAKALGITADLQKRQQNDKEVQ